MQKNKKQVLQQFFNIPNLEKYILLFLRWNCTVSFIHSSDQVEGE